LVQTTLAPAVRSIAVLHISKAVLQRQLGFRQFLAQVRCVTELRDPARTDDRRLCLTNDAQSRWLEARELVDELSAGKRGDGDLAVSSGASTEYSPATTGQA
jgi:hypothetical protein